MNLPEQKAFSLVELMIVVGIIGILSTLALPRFRQFQAKAKMSEAKTILLHIHTLEQTFMLENNTFLAHAQLGRTSTGTLTAASCTPDANAARLGFRLDPCIAGAAVPRYGYRTRGGVLGIATSFLSRANSGGDLEANSVCPGNRAHYISIDEKKVYGGRFIGTAEPNASAVCRL